MPLLSVSKFWSARKMLQSNPAPSFYIELTLRAHRRVRVPARGVDAHVARVDGGVEERVYLGILVGVDDALAQAYVAT